MIKPLDDQVELINRAKDKIRGGCKSLLIQGATGSGKTVIAAEIVSGAYRKGKTCHFVVPRRDLLRQTSLTFKQFNIPHTFIAAGLQTYVRNNIFICSLQTLTRRITPAPDLAVIDECHIGEEGLDKLIKFYKENGTIIILLSATPWKLSGKGLRCWADDMVCGPSIRWLINSNRLSDYRAFAPSHPDMSQIKIVAGDYAKGELAQKMENDRVLIGNAVEHYKKHASGKLSIAYCASILHSQITAQAFNDAGIPAMHMDGTTPDEERVQIIKSFARREILVITNCQLLTYGFDLSSNSGMDVTVECMSDLSPTKSLALQLQKWGRVLRRKDFPALIFDHANNIKEHGLPCDEREWSLEDRDKICRNGAERKVAVRQCLPAEDADGVIRGCHFCHKPSPVCPNCGRVYKAESRELVTKEGELEEIKISTQKKESRVQQGRARSLEDLIAIGKQRGYPFPRAWALKVLGGRKK